MKIQKKISICFVCHSGDKGLPASFKVNNWLNGNLIDHGKYTSTKICSIL